MEVAVTAAALRAVVVASGGLAVRSTLSTEPASSTAQVDRIEVVLRIGSVALIRFLFQKV